MRRILTGVLILAIIASCAKPKDLEFVDIQNIKMVKWGLSESLVGLDVRFYNPNKQQVNLKDAVAKVYVNSAFLGETNMDTTIAIPRRDTFAVPKEKKVVADKTQTGVWLTFIPVMDTDEFGDEIVEELKIHLINRTDTPYNFDYSLEYSGKPGFELKNTIAPFQDFYIHDMPFENVNDSPALSVIFSLQKPDKKKAESFETTLKLKPKQVFSRIQDIRQKGEATFAYKILDKYPDRPVEDKMEMSPLLKKGYKVYSASSARQHLEPSKYELDLHIEKLTKEHARLDSFEKLTLQLQTLEKYLDLAVAHHQPRKPTGAKF